MEIREEAEKSLVFINGLAIFAFVDEELCHKCNKNKLYSYDYDAFFCIHCDEWLEQPCQDPDCKHCKERPPKPSNLLEKPEDPDDPKFLRTDNPPRKAEEQLEYDLMVTEFNDDFEIFKDK